MGPQVQLSDFVGEYGSYQLSLTVFLFIRYVFLGLMANSGPLMTPDVTFYCKLPMEEIVAIMPNITMLNKSEQEIEIKEEFKRICQIDLHLYHQNYLNYTNKKGSDHRKLLNITTNRIRECDDFNYDIALDQGHTMTSEFDLVCDRDWLRSLFQSLISASIVVAHVFWGTFSDKYGRLRAQKLCLAISLMAGSLSFVATDFWTFVIARALCSFGDLGLVVSLTTTVVELVGNQYRGLSVAIVNFGYALGVAILPYIVAYLEDFRLVILFTIFCHTVTIPVIFATSESVRWLLTNRKFKAARKELKRIARWNRKLPLCCCTRNSDPRIEQKDKSLNKISNKEEFEISFKKLIDQLESQNLCDPLGSIPDESIRLSVNTHFENNEDSFANTIDKQSKDVNKGLSEKSASICYLYYQPETAIKHQEEDGNKKLYRTESCCQFKDSVIEDYEEKNYGFKDGLVRPQLQQPDCINLVASQLSFVGRVNRLFRDKKLMLTVFTIVWTTFNSELQYTSFIIINLEVGEDVYLNYLLGGCMELLAAITASLLLSYAPRRSSLIAFWLLISLSCFGLSIAHIDSTWAVWLLALAKFSQSCLSSIACVAAYESFPTFLRQSGSGLVFTLGMLGSVFAPLIFAEFDDHAGMDRVLMTFSLSSLTAAILILKFLKETKNCELQ